MPSNIQQTIIAASLAIALLGTGCHKDYWPHSVETTITKPVVAAPDNNQLIVLDPLSNAIVTFEWQKATTGNFTPVYYKLLFATENGSFAKPVYTATPGSVGTQLTLLLSHRELNKVANNAGIKALQTGKVKWTVVASNGVVSDTAAAIRMLTLERPAGFAENPADVFITGTAAEGGTDVTKALKFKKLADGVFELYTSLNAGTYRFVDKTTGTPVTFSLEGTLIKEGAETNSGVTAKTPYRIHLDFNNATAKLTEITEVGLWLAGSNAVTTVLPYEAGGIWKAVDIPIVWSVQSWGKDERYKFRLKEKDAAGTVTTVFLASVTKDNTRPTSSTAASYYYFKSNDASQWDYTWKFEKEAAKADILVKFGITDTYTHQIVYK